MEVYYFTFTGTSKRIAEFISKTLDLTPKEIKSYRLPYLIWLILSFIPFLSLKAEFELPKAQTIILCFPKWTLNCPPVTYFLKKVKCKRLILIISHKGWKERPYAKLYRKIALRSSEKVSIVLIKQKVWKEFENMI